VSDSRGPLPGRGAATGPRISHTTARRLIVVALVFLASIAFIGLADLGTDVMVGKPLRAVDAVAAARSASLRTPAGDVFFGAVTRLGDQLVASLLVAAAALGLWLAHKRADAVFVVGVVASGALLNTLLKQLFDRVRPPADLAAVPIPLSPSFPSGHTVAAFLFFGALAVVVLVEIGPTWKGLLLASALALTGVAVGYTRLYLGVHWLTDVIGGWLLATGWLALWTAGLIGLRERGAQAPRRAGG
jgi:membrane-associated phospholipid phosphatase